VTSLLLIAGVLCADPAAPLPAKKARVEALLMECEGPVFVKRNGSSIRLSAGEKLHDGETLLVPEDSDALLLYRGGRHVRLQGPARSIITAAAADDGAGAGSTANGWQGRFAALFAERDTAALATTVGGVRKPVPLLLLSPRSEGYTPSDFRVAWDFRGSQGGVGVADRVCIRVLDGERTVLTRHVDPFAGQRTSLRIDLRALENDSKPQHYRMALEFVAIDEFGEEQSIGDPRLIDFKVAPPGVETALAKQLDELERLYGKHAAPAARSSTLLAVARAETYLAHGFHGEALAEIAAQLRTHPQNALWQQMLERCLSAASAGPASAATAGQAGS
jgi:hypothetical protein